MASIGGCGLDKNETFDVEDGYDTIEWAAKLPQSDGRVGTWGHSNASWAIWMTLHSNPPSLVAALASGISMSMLDITFGVWETGRRLEWTYMMAADVRRREGRTDGPTDPVEATYRWNAVERSKYVWWLPLADIPEHVFAGLTDQYQTFLRNTNQDYMRFDDAHPKADVPVMQITGWWDRLIGTIDNYEGLITNGDPDLRNQHRLIVGPWGHDATNYNGKIGPIDYGPKADTTYADLIVRWYDYDLKGVDNGTADQKPVQLFVLNRNEWIGADAWPLPETRYTDLYLSSGGSANSVHGDGTLSFDVPTNAVSDEFDYDPRDPVMSLMHQNSQSIPINQAPNDHRQDILVYETDPHDRRPRRHRPGSIETLGIHRRARNRFRCQTRDRPRGRPLRQSHLRHHPHPGTVMVSTKSQTRNPESRINTTSNRTQSDVVS